MHVCYNDYFLFFYLFFFFVKLYDTYDTYFSCKIRIIIILTKDLGNIYLYLIYNYNKYRHTSYLFTLLVCFHTMCNDLTLLNYLNYIQHLPFKVYYDLIDTLIALKRL